MPYWQLFYHIVWSTRDREPRITPDVEPIIYDFLRAKAFGLGGIVYALNGMADHVHMVASVPPKIALSTFIGQVKGVTTAKYNKLVAPDHPIYWQQEYGVFSFDRKRLPAVVAYVDRQKQHHAAHDVIPVLECDSEEPSTPIAELPVYYGDFQELRDLL